MTNAYNPGSQFRPRSPYGWRIDPLHDNKEEFHAGQDFAAPAGTPFPPRALERWSIPGSIRALGMW